MEGFLTSAAGTPPHMGVKVFLLVLHYLEICLYIVEALSTFWCPVGDYFLQWRGFPYKRCGLSNPRSPRLEEGFILGSEGSPVLSHWSLHSLQSREVLIWIQKENSAFWDPRLFSVRIYSSAEEVLWSPSLPGIYLPWDLEQVWTNLMISTSVGSFCF